jgi:hypothetical protein
MRKKTNPAGVHPLENDKDEAAYFARVVGWRGGGCGGVYRHAVIACSGGLPTWAQRAKPGPKPKGGKSA